jgi:phosphoribosyl-ATP pyrophosphohydrolase/phosphoribosyl-AMP cyclohydrolase
MAAVLDKLFALIEERRENAPAGSYTTLLLQDRPKAARKVGEEAVEVAIAALAEEDHALISESADLIYHLFVLLASRNLTLADVEAELARRMQG